jgi:hypothetical protein
VLAGLVALGEHLPSTPSLRLIRLASWLIILMGVTALGVGSGGLLEALAGVVAALQLPAWVRRWLPRPVALLVQRLTKVEDHDGDGRGALPVYSQVTSPQWRADNV